VGAQSQSVLSRASSAIPSIGEEEVAAMGRIDSVDRPIAEIIRILRFILCHEVGVGGPQSDVAIGKPLHYLGLDSAQFIQFQVLPRSLSPSRL
jgi:hypothetical protein